MLGNKGILTAGLDEAGRGPLAGPVYAASVILPPDFPTEILNDSKKLSAKKREAAFKHITERAIWGIGSASHTEIDEINILRASLLAMKRAFEAMTTKMTKEKLQRLGEVIVDGLYVPDFAAPYSFNARAVVKADAAFPCVMAASILAKVSRDREMCRLAALYPGYGYEQHKGYPTKAHLAAIRSLPPSPIARKTFRGALPCD
jgi:ribonuclease HII